MIPLGLVLMTSIAFAVGAAKLASRQVLVNELPAVEGLARVDIICLDKTGTLTAGDIEFDGAHPVPDAAPGVDAVLAWYGAAPNANATARCLRVPYPVDAPLEVARRHPVLLRAEVERGGVHGGPRGTWVLGAPEMIFGDAASDRATELGRTVTDLASTGLRTLVLAHAATALTDDEVEAERLPEGVAPAVVLTFREQVRPDAAQTLAYFREQGVGIRIISGDNPRTVAAIAREVGLEVTEGFDARKLPEDDAALGEVLEAHAVFGRVTPEQKKRMVVALQARGHTVAMTGDGVNDALAIKTADIGIAMNSGSAATKAVARLVLLDGQFSHLPDVVAEGRQVIANIERVSMLFLNKTVYATGLAILFGLLVLEFPFLPRQLSITDGLTIGIPAFFLALMHNSQRYVPGFLKRSLSFAIPSGSSSPWRSRCTRSAPCRSSAEEPELRTGSTIILAIVGHLGAHGAVAPDHPLQGARDRCHVHRARRDLHGPPRIGVLRAGRSRRGGRVSHRDRDRRHDRRHRDRAVLPPSIRREGTREGGRDEPRLSLPLRVHRLDGGGEEVPRSGRRPQGEA